MPIGKLSGLNPAISKKTEKNPDFHIHRKFHTDKFLMQNRKIFCTDLLMLLSGKKTVIFDRSIN
jgi:hypothetical protein